MRAQGTMEDLLGFSRDGDLELPGANRDFDMFESIRSAAVSQAVEHFAASVS
jgi:hypothetical protein